MFRFMVQCKKFYAGIFALLAVFRGYVFERQSQIHTSFR